MTVRKQKNEKVLITNSNGEWTVYQARNGEYRGRFVHNNGNIQATLGEGYKNRKAAEAAVFSVTEPTSRGKLAIAEELQKEEPLKKGWWRSFVELFTD